MTKTEPTLSAETGGTEITRFNALKHGVLSRYSVLPWEDAAEYHDLVTALAAEHAPQGPTEERDTVEACRSIDVNRLQKEGCLRSGWLGGWQWTHDGDRSA